MRACGHDRIILFGSEETGLRTAKCERCGVTMNRRAVRINGAWEWQYEPETEVR